MHLPSLPPSPLPRLAGIFTDLTMVRSWVAAQVKRLTGDAMPVPVMDFPRRGGTWKGRRLEGAR